MIGVAVEKPTNRLNVRLNYFVDIYGRFRA